ncbi:MAG: NADH:flavin oxidoreductase [Anaerovoracaceae bacterium]
MIMINTPLRTEKLNFKNRLAYPPIFVGKASPDGKITQDTLDYYDEKTKDGAFSMVTIEHSFIMQEGKASSGQVSVADDSTIEGLSKLAQTIHANGTNAVLQLNHAGSCSEESITGMPLAGPSHVENPRKGGTPREMSIEDIKAVEEAFLAAAIRGKEAGFDGVEIHGAHSYLLNQFYSPLSNFRKDQYGGSLENRIRIHLEIIQKVRQELGNNYPIFLRLGACDHREGGSQIEDGVAAAKAFVEAGVDVLDISGGMCGYVNPESTKPGYFGEEAKAIKEAVDVPVILTGGVKTPEDIETLLQAGAADIIGVGRTAMADSTWAKKAIEFYQE